MRLGIFAKTFVRSSLEAVLDAVCKNGFDCLQFNMACAGLPSMPEEVAPELCRRIAGELRVRGIDMAAVSGTFNMIHPDPARRQDGLRRLRVLAQACAGMGTKVITLCTGTRDPVDMWRRHPANDAADAWRDLVDTMTQALGIAEEADVTLAFEVEVSNVVDSAKKGRRLLDEMRSGRLRVVMDPANLFHAGELPRMSEILDAAFELLGERIVIAHAKDLSHDGDAGHEAAGTGLLDYDRYVGLLHEYAFSGPLILHGLAEAQVPASRSFLTKLLSGGDTC